MKISILYVYEVDGEDSGDSVSEILGYACESLALKLKNPISHKGGKETLEIEIS